MLMLAKKGVNAFLNQKAKHLPRYPVNKRQKTGRIFIKPVRQDLQERLMGTTCRCLTGLGVPVSFTDIGKEGDHE
jgi:hypothetical protein